MSNDNFNAALALTLCYEGGKVDNPADPGGRTNKGITQATYDAWNAKHGYAKADVFDITDDAVRTLYQEEYWTLSGADRLPIGLDAAVFDFAVNSGVATAVKVLQRRLNVSDDGIFGAITLNAIPGDYASLIEDYSDDRLKFMKSLRTWATFGGGWERRVRGVEDYTYRQAKAALEPDQHPAPTELPAGPSAQKADASQTAFLRTKQGLATLGTTLVASAGTAAPVANQAAEQLKPYIGHSFIGEAALYGVVALTAIGGAFALANVIKPYIKTN